ncbi:YbaN family protein [Gilvimarinus polysaccharolyticus]|uniref:YbaN family protein n=1 Tax=Gilvimarinus polysaccharolyticus TaxID=863921 RepID=UPI0006732811|nr:YbaN family protein [Gilvimarinus polysaccharolyticus]
MLFIWRALALMFVGVGLLGVVVPGLPTTVFLILGAWASNHGWPAFNQWLLRHPRFGPPILRWQRHGAVPRRAKYLAAITMSMSGVLIVLSAMQVWFKCGLLLTMCTVLVWLCLRPEISSSVDEEND